MPDEWVKGLKGEVSAFILRRKYPLNAILHQLSTRPTMALSVLEGSRTWL